MRYFLFCSFQKHVLSTLCLIGSLAMSTSASAVIINFDTDQAGNPYTGAGDHFVAAEYTGVIINDSDPTAGITYVNQINPLNVGTAISGYYVNIGAFDGVQTQLTLDFTTAVTEIGFDYANPTGNLSVWAYDSLDNLLDMSNYLGGDAFINQAGFDQFAGYVSVSGVGNISRLVIEPGSNQALIVDNLDFRPVPLPAALPLFAAGLVGMGLIRRRKS